MKQNRKIKLGLLGITILMTLSFSSCKKFVTTDLPNNQITGPAVFEDVSTANAAVIDIYIQLRQQVLVTGNNYGISVQLGSYADEINAYGSVIQTPEFFKNSILPTDGSIANVWNDNYKLIYSANAIIEGLELSSKIATQDKNRLKGEALFIRAYIHFYLLNLFGEIPYIKTTDYRINSKVSRMTSEVVYAAIIEDLKQAKDLMPDAYPTAERVRPNQSVARAMLARVYLYNKKWSDAETEASAVIGNPLFTWVENLDNVFLNTSTGTLWQLFPARAGVNTNEAQTFIFPSLTASTPPSSALSADLLNSFEEGDLRKTHWIGSATRGSDIYYYPYKYKRNIDTPPISQEYSILFRLEELYLIRAEARANQDNIIGAVADLNKIRARARAAATVDMPNPLPDYPSTISKDDCLDAVLHERRVELFTEHGHRFFDLKRTGKANTILGAVKSNWTSTDLLWPLPAKELEVNPNLKPQNPGYQ